MSVPDARPAGLLDELERLLGKTHVLSDEHSRVLYAQDISVRGEPALAVIRPGTVDELAAAVRLVTAAGNAVIGRGGGMSYTRGYVPSEADSVIIDTCRLGRVLEINADDMYVTVESGCTWKALHEALDGTGLRTPFWGTLSGIHATIGGGLSQNGIFWGSGRHGSAVDSVLSLDVVLADGSVVSTGSGARDHGSPFFRHYGPDLTGLFCADAGALGIKARATLKLIPLCKHRTQLSFAFTEVEPLIMTMSAIARQGLADECFAFDPYLQAVRLQRESMMSDVKKLAGVMKAGGSLAGALREGARVAIAGRGFMTDVEFSLHVLVEQRTAEAALDAGAAVRELAALHGGKEIENSIPKILRANPFTPLNNVLGPNGERWLPIHVLVPHSKAVEATAAARAIFNDREQVLREQGIGIGFLFATVATNAFVIEPVFFTPDAMGELHRATVESSALRRMKGFAPNPSAAALTQEVRQQVIDAFQSLGGIHMQIGKSYPYREGLQSGSFAIVQALKAAVDPHCRVNPGALGLHPH